MAWGLRGVRSLSPRLVKAVLAVADAEWQSIIRFELYTGQRLADVARLTWGNIDLQRKEIRLTARKTGKRLTIPIAAPLHAHILTLDAGDSPTIPLHPRAYGVVEKQGRANTLSNWFAGNWEGLQTIAKTVGNYELSYKTLPSQSAAMVWTMVACDQLWENGCNRNRVTKVAIRAEAERLWARAIVTGRN